MRCITLTWIYRIFIVLTVSSVTVMIANTLWAQNVDIHQHHIDPSANSENQPVAVSGLMIPDVELVDQSGKKVHFYSDLVKGKVVAINTIFTTCTTICPVMGANFSKLSKLLPNEKEKINLVSVSIDPAVDTPERLKQWSKGFGEPGANWTLLTGRKADVDGLLKALQVFTADKQNHAPVVLIGGAGGGNWTRASALLTPSRLAELIRARANLAGGTPLTPQVTTAATLKTVPAQQSAASKREALSAAALQYFTDVRLLTQNSDSVRLYSDLLKDKVVVINAFFGTCTDVCPVISGILAGLQEKLGDRLGKDVFFLSFSVDPEIDTPDQLKQYAERFHAKPGWLFLTGKKENINFALSRLGQKVDRKEDHLTVFMIGNNKTGLWKKVLAPTTTADSLKLIVESVLNDKG